MRVSKQACTPAVTNGQLGNPQPAPVSSFTLFSPLKKISSSYEGSVKGK